MAFGENEEEEEEDLQDLDEPFFGFDKPPSNSYKAENTFSAVELKMIPCDCNVVSVPEVANCKYKIFGCKWRGYAIDQFGHEAACRFSWKTEKELLEIVDNSCRSQESETMCIAEFMQAMKLAQVEDKELLLGRDLPENTIDLPFSAFPFYVAGRECMFDAHLFNGLVTDPELVGDMSLEYSLTPRPMHPRQPKPLYYLARLANAEHETLPCNVRNHILTVPKCMARRLITDPSEVIAIKLTVFEVDSDCSVV